MYKYSDALKEKLLVEETISTMKIISNLMAIPLFLVFWFADILIYPELKWEFLAYRLLIIPFCFGTQYLVSKVRTYTAIQALSSIYCIMTSSIINLIIY